MALRPLHSQCGAKHNRHYFPPAIAIAECEKAEGARAEGGEQKRKREGCGL